MTGIHLKYELNSNTIIMVIGFFGMIATGAFWVNDSQRTLADNTKRLDSHDAIFTQMTARFDAIDKRDADTRDLQFRVGALEKAIELQDIRTSRIVESYGSKFTEFGVSLSSIITQQALQNQSLQRVEAALAKAPAP